MQTPLRKPFKSELTNPPTESQTKTSLPKRKDPGNGWTTISRGPRLESDPKTGKVRLAEKGDVTLGSGLGALQPSPKPPVKLATTNLHRECVDERSSRAISF